jgi:hypothetical protein
MEFNDDFFSIIMNSLNGVGGFNMENFVPPKQMWQVVIPMPGVMILIDRDILRQYLDESDGEYGEETY